MLKEGHKHLSGLDEAVLKNIDACKQLSFITRTSLGPNGMYLDCVYVSLLFFFLSGCVYFAAKSGSVALFCSSSRFVILLFGFLVFVCSIGSVLLLI